MFALPSYGVTVLVLQGKLERLSTTLIALVAVLSVGLSALVFRLYLLIADSPIPDRLHLPFVLLLLAPFVSPVIGLYASYALVRKWRRDSAIEA